MSEVPVCPAYPLRVLSLTLPNGHTITPARNVQAIWMIDETHIIVVNRGGGRELIHPYGCRISYQRGASAAGR